LPTAWALESYRAARIYLVNRDSRRIDENDIADWGHYGAAIHAETLVVEDSKFRSIVEECPPPKPRVVRLVEWARALLGYDRG
jgi:hypothetical protein